MILSSLEPKDMPRSGVNGRLSLSVWFHLVQLVKRGKTIVPLDQILDPPLFTVTKFSIFLQKNLVFGSENVSASHKIVEKWLGLLKIHRLHRSRQSILSQQKSCHFLLDFNYIFSTSSSSFFYKHEIVETVKFSVWKKLIGATWFIVCASQKILWKRFIAISSFCLNTVFEYTDK